MKVIMKLGILFALLVFFTSCESVNVESDEIVYGPIEMTYDLPDVPGKIYYVSPEGEANSEGLSVNSPTTIDEAIKRVVSGDAIVMRGGIYRTGDLTFNQGITIQAYGNEKPVLNGTLVADSWTPAGDNLWVTDWEYFFPAGPEDWWNRARNEAHTPLHRFNNDAVFIDGQYLQSAGDKTEVDEGTYFVDYDNKKIYIGVDPSDRFVEITAFRKSLFRTLDPVHGKQPDNRGPVIRGITFTQYPDTMVHIGGVGLAIDQHGRDAVGTVFENCTFSNNFRIAMFALSDSLVMRNCKVYNTNAEGIYVVASNDILLERNIIKNNNIENWTGFYPSAVKIFNQSHRAIVRENLVVDHANSNGVWWDVGNLNGVFVNNHVIDVAHSGLFFEISKGLTVAGNVFENCDQSIFVLNASDVEIYNNTFINSRLNFSRNNRGDQLGTFGWHVTLGPDVEERFGHVVKNNLFYMNEKTNSTMIVTNQPSDMCERLNVPHLKQIDNNVYVRNFDAEEEKPVLIKWTPFENEDCSADLFSPEELNALITQFSANSMYFENIDMEEYFTEKAKGFGLSETFPGNAAAAATPAHVLNFMGMSTESESFIGSKMK